MKLPLGCDRPAKLWISNTRKWLCGPPLGLESEAGNGGSVCCCCLVFAPVAARNGAENDDENNGGDDITVGMLVCDGNIDICSGLWTGASQSYF
mmetsp:Transcript_13135/g.27783  ORF Transcript_13135/g.27783 Transcript_13135/m.27783 type:complete len:94 (-) Transcript_13135:199-480(-)